MSEQTAGQKWSEAKFNAQSHGVIYVRDIDANNTGLFIKLKVNDSIVERQVDTSAVS